MDTILNYPSTAALILGLPLLGIVAKFFGVTFSRISKWYLFVAVFAVVIVMTSIFFPFIGGKDYFFRTAIQLSLIFYVLAWAFEARAGEIEAHIKAAFKNPLVIATTIFLVIFLLACAFALDPHAAFWSNYERGEGGFQVIHYYLFFLLLALLMRREDDWKNIFRFSLVAGMLMIIYGVLGNFGVNGFIGAYASGTIPTGFWHILIDGRFQGSLGNPAYVAPYLIFSMFFAAYLWVKKRQAGTANIWTNIGYGSLIVVFLIFFILSQTRGAFLGLGAGVFVLLLYVLMKAGGKVRKWSLIILLLFIALGIGVYTFRNTNFIQNLPAGRLLQISFSDTTAQTRFWTWGSAWKGFLERPILGWGPENFTAVFDKYFNPKHYIPGQNTETWFDRAHSLLFDYLSETGILGLLSYLAMFGIVFWMFFRRKGADQAGSSRTAIERGLVLAVPVAYLVQGVAIFDVLPMYLNLFLFLAFAVHYFQAHQTQTHG